MSAKTHQPDTSQARQTRKRETRLQILLPFLLGLVILLAMVAVAAIFLMPEQVSVVTDLMWSLLVLCPTVICLLPIQFGLVAALVWMHRLTNQAIDPLESLEQSTQSLRQRSDDIAGRINARVVRASAAIEPIMALMRFLEAARWRPDNNEDVNDSEFDSEQ